ncbi:MAG: NAD(P)H-hydrate epimerase [Phycisphaerales bacterium]|nr:NAD(P)H-hydrate epimerase [Phycisphaerales bacterium]
MTGTGENPSEFDVVLDRAAARRLDATAIKRLGMPGILLMEHAAIGIARLVEQVRIDAGLAAVTIVCGTGNNGGDGWAVARLLANRGIHVGVVTTGSAPTGTDAATNERIARSMGLPIRAAASLIRGELTPRTPADPDPWPDPRSTLVVDAIFGTGLNRPLIDQEAAELVDAMNRTAAAIVSVDVPSGLDADTGRPLGACIRANVTATMVAPKLGMSNPESAAWTGRIEVIDIGTPSDLLIEFGITTRSGPIEDDVEDVRPPAT